MTANVKGVEFLFKKNKVTWLKGEGRIVAPGRVAVAGTEYETKNIVIASGSESMPLPASRWMRRPSSPRPARWSWARSPATWW